MIFERKIMRKIFGPTRTDDGYWRIKTNQEINDILKGQNIIEFIKKQRLNWLGHVECMAEDNMRSVRKVSDRIFLCEHLMDYNLARLHEPTLNLSAHA